MWHHKWPIVPGVLNGKTDPVSDRGTGNFSGMLPPCLVLVHTTNGTLTIETINCEAFQSMEALLVLKGSMFR